MSVSDEVGDNVLAPEAPRAEREIVLEVTDLVKHFPITKGILFRKKVGEISAVDGVSLRLRAGETLALVGESGCGKSTLAKLIMGLETPTSGTIEAYGVDTSTMSSRQTAELRKRMQIILQDPYTSLNPRMNIGSIVGEPLSIHEPGMSSKERSQRVGIARALPFNPGIVIADEPVSALDVSVQAQVINLLKDLRDEFGIAYLFISHDLAIVRQIADRVAVMYLGRLAETGTQEQIYSSPAHPYTQALLSAVPLPDPTLRDVRESIVLDGDVPSPADPPSGCRFRTRCWKAQDICAEEQPLLQIRPGVDHEVACHFAEVRQDVV